MYWRNTITRLGSPIRNKRCTNSQTNQARVPVKRSRPILTTPKPRPTVASVPLSTSGDSRPHGKDLGQGQGLVATIGAVGIDKELGVRPDRLACIRDTCGVGIGMPADLHFDVRN